MQRNSSFPLVLVLSSISLVLIFVLIGVSFWQHDRRELDRGLEQESLALRTTFEVALSDLEQQMLGLATMVAADPQVQTLFWQGKQALLSEGGGPGTGRTADLRERLYQHIAPVWRHMQHEFGLRQLHFQLGPGSLSYLRVHTPDRYGDRMDGLRHIIEDVNRDQQSRSGFETGRVYSGVRGVVPVWHTDNNGEREYIGALEAGTAFEVQLSRLDQMVGAGFAVMLRREHVEDSVWKNYRSLSGPRAEKGCQCYLEAYSREQVQEWMHAAIMGPLSGAETQSELLEWQGVTWHLTRFPLQDYLATIQPERGHVGSVLVWRDKTEALASWYSEQWKTQFMVFLSYLLAQFGLFWALKVTRLTLQKRIDNAVAALTDSERILHRAQTVAHMGSWELDATSDKLLWSPEVRQIFGLSQDEVPDYNLFLSFIHPDDRCYVNEAWQAALQGAPYDIEHRIQVNGQTRWVREMAELSIAEDGKLLSVLGTVQDITNIKQMELELRRSEERYRTTFAAVNDGVWEWNVPEGIVKWDAHCYEMLGYAPDAFEVSIDVWQQLIHPDDVEQAYSEVERQLVEGETFAIEFRYRSADASWMWVKGRGKVVKWDQGKPLLVVGTHTDITARKQAEEALYRMAQRNKLLLNAAGEGIYGVDQQGNTTFINPAALAMLGYAEAEILGKEQHDIFHYVRPDGRHYPESECPVYLTLTDGQTRRVDDEWFIRKDGSYLPVTMTVAPVDEEGQPRGVVVLFQDITERKERELELRRLATTDTLTGLPNRRYFLERLEQELSRFQRYQKPTALLMIDIDHFKRVNDTYGHAAGDAVLRQFAKLIQQSLRKIDVVGRVGGEEFAVLLPGSDLDGAYIFGERLRLEVEKTPCIHGDERLNYTISLGITLFNQSDKTSDQPLARADAGLYAAKGNGRNRLEAVD